MRLLLISDSVVGYETFVSASNENTEVILFNKNEDTYDSILAKKKLNEYESVGIVDYNYSYILEKELDIFNLEGKDSLVLFLKGFNTPIVDFMACYLFKIDVWKSVFDHIETEGINARSSIDATGNLFAGGNFLLESEEEAVNVKDLYFTELISEYTGLLDVQRNVSFYNNYNENAETTDYTICRFLTSNLTVGSITTGSYALLYKKFKKVWVSSYGANQNTYNGFWLVDQNGDVIDNVESMYGNEQGIILKTSTYSYIFYYLRNSYADIINDGPTGGPLTNITDIKYNSAAFAIYNDSNIYGIGSAGSGGISFAYATPIRLQNGTTGPFLDDVDKIYSVRGAFAVKGASGVYVWGSNTQGGINTAFATQLRLENGTTGPFLTDVQDIYTASSSNDGAFVAKGVSGLYAWGTTSIGGIASTSFATQLRLQNGTTGPFLTDIQEIYPNNRSFSVKGASGVYVWGSSTEGGIATSFATQVRIDNGTTGPFLTDVDYIAPGFDAYVAKGPSGLYIWGTSVAGAPATNYASLIKSGPGGSTGPLLEGITDIYPNDFGFLFKGDSGAYITGDLNGVWPITYAQQVLTGGNIGDAISPIDNISSSTQLYSIDSNNTVYNILSNTLIPNTYYPYKSVSGRPNMLLYNDTELFTTDKLNAPITSLYKSISVPTTGITPLLNGFAMAFIRNGNVFINGNGNQGGRYTLMSLKQYEFGITGPFLNDITNIYSTKYTPVDTSATYVAKGASGVYAWGNATTGGIATSFATQVRIDNGTTGSFLTDVQDVYSNNNAYAVKGSSGVYAWGSVNEGGIATSFATQLRLQNGTTGPFLTDIDTIYNNSVSFTTKGSSGLYAWGSALNGGIATGFATQLRLQNGTTGPFLTDVQDVYSNNNAYAVKGSSGVYCWGATGAGGLSTTFATQLRLQNGTTGPFLTDVDYIVPINNEVGIANLNSFVAKGASGIYAWGAGNGGINANFATQLRLQNGTTGPFLTDIQEIYTNIGSCAVKGASGIYAWGVNSFGGLSSNLFASQLRLQNGTTGPFLTDVISITSNTRAYAARGASGVYCWGSTSVGGLSTAFATQLRLQNGTTGPFLTDVLDIVSNNQAFAVRGANGIYSWGTSHGGINASFATQVRINDATSGPFLTDVEELYGSNNFFVAKTNQNFYIWGDISGAATNFAQAVNITDAEAIIRPNNLLNTTIDLTTNTTTVEELLIKTNNNAEGIAITKATNWRYKPSSSDWKSIENVSDTNGLLLLKSTALEYISGKNARVAEPTLEFNAWNGEIGDEEDYLNTNLEYFNLVSDNKASVTVEEKTTPSKDNSTVRIIMIVLLVVVGIFLLILIVWFFFGRRSSGPVVPANSVGANISLVSRY